MTVDDLEPAIPDWWEYDEAAVDSLKRLYVDGAIDDIELEMRLEQEMSRPAYNDALLAEYILQQCSQLEAALVRSGPCSS